MPDFAAFKPSLARLWPAAGSIAGCALLLGAWKWASLMPQSDTLMTLAIVLWALIPSFFAGLILVPRAPERITLRFLLLFWPFALIVLMGKSWHYHVLAAQAIAMAGWLMLALALPRWAKAQAWLERLPAWLAWHERIGDVMFPRLLFILFIDVAVTLSWVCFDFHPAYTDSAAQYIHGKFVASGHLFYIPAHKYPEFFQVWLMIHGDHGKWYSQYPPMQQTLLGLGHRLHAPWLVSPVEGALTLLAVYGIARRTWGEATGRLAAILFVLSPFVMFMSAEFMNHSPTLMFGTLLCYCYLRWQEEECDPDWADRWALLSGLCAGGAFLSRPLTGVAISLPFALHALSRLWKNRHGRYAPYLWAALGGLVCVVCQLIFNKETTGEWFTYAYTRYHSNSFGRAMGYNGAQGIAHTIDKMRDEWYMLDLNMFEWALPSVFFLIIPCLAPKNLATKLLLGVIVSQTLFNLLNQFSSSIFGPRYMFEISSAFIILTAAGMMRLPSLFGRLRPMSLAAAQGAAILLVLLPFVSAATGRWPQRLHDYSHFMDSHPEFIRSMMEQSRQPALIFLGRVPEGEKPGPDPQATFRQTVWTNPPDPEAPAIFAMDKGDEKDRKLMAMYPDHHAYVETQGKLTPLEASP